MRPWKRAAIAVIAFMVCLATGSNRAWAWGTVTHQWLNQEVRQNRSPYFIYAGSYPDMAIFYPELADHYHAPVVKRGEFPLTDASYAASHNFAALWLDELEARGASSRAVDIADGWGCHIAADWVAHSWLPIAVEGDEQKVAGDLLHLGVEFVSDEYTLLAHPFLPGQPLNSCLNPHELRALLISHAVADFAKAYSPGELRWFRREWATHPLFEDWQQVAGRAEHYPALMFVMRTLVVRAIVNNPLGAGYITDFGSAVLEPLYEQSKVQCREWLAHHRPAGVPDDIVVTPLYDPDAPLPPGEVTEPAPPPPGTVEQWRNEVVQALTDEAMAAGLLSVEEVATSEPGVSEYVAVVPDEEALGGFLAQALSEMSEPAAAATGADDGPGGLQSGGLSEGARLAALVLDRMVNRGVADPEVAADVAPPRVVPVTPLPGETVRSLRPLLSATVIDLGPSSGLDYGTLTVLVDGRPVKASIGDNPGTFSARPDADLGQGYHSLQVSVADALGQSTMVDWPFIVALHLRWLPPLVAPGRGDWLATQTVPVAFTLTDENGTFGVDPGVTVRVFDPNDPSGSRSRLYSVGEGAEGIRIDTQAERYIVNVKLKDLWWVKTTPTVAVRVEAGGVVLGEYLGSIRWSRGS